jgi:hypothetical protein
MIYNVLTCALRLVLRDCHFFVNYVYIIIISDLTTLINSHKNEFYELIPLFMSTIVVPEFIVFFLGRNVEEICIENLSVYEAVHYTLLLINSLYPSYNAAHTVLESQFLCFNLSLVLSASVCMCVCIIIIIIITSNSLIH